MSRKFTLKYLLFALCFIGVLSAANAQLVTIGTGTTTTSSAPLYSCANYSYSQQIYTATEILAANGGVVPNGQIVYLKFNYSINSYNSGASGSNTWTIYMGNTTTGTFASTTSWIPISGMTQVFNGAIQLPAVGNWMTIPLTVPFNWDGVSNIVVAVNENNPGSDCLMYWTATSTNPSYETMYYYSYSANPSLTSPPTATARSYTRPNVQFQWAPACSATTGYPTTGAVAASPTSLCLSGNVTLTFTPPTAFPLATGITYKWQSCPTATGTFVDIPGAVTTSPTYTTTTPISTATYYKCVVLCGGTTTILTSTASNGVTITNPGTVTPTAGARCGPGSVTLTATQTVPANTIAWYTSALGGMSIGSGASFATPYIPTTTTFYVDAEAQGAPATLQVGTGTSSNGTTSYPSPYGDFYTATHEQYLITANELYAAGFSQGNFNSIAFNLAVGYPSSPLQFYNVQMANTSATALSTAGLITTGFTNVVPQATYTPPASAGWATIPFTTPFNWDGASNVVVDVSYNNAGPSCITNYNNNGNGQVFQTSTSFASSHSIYADANCSINSMNPQPYYSNYVYNQRPNMQFNTLPVCASPRQAVVATVNASPALSIAKSPVLCSNEIRPITITTIPSTNYTNYAWTTNIAGLYTNAAATTPYTSGSAPTVYVKSAQSNVHTYYLFASGATPTACTHADTISVFVQPDSITISGAPDSICVSGTSTMTLVPDTGYAPNSIQWQQSVNGTGYVNIPGATSSSYTTPTLTADHYYRALIKSTNDTCEMPVKHMVVSNPQLLGATDGFSCGPGPVTLNAQSGGNSALRWYDVPTGGNPLAEGNTFVTPYLGTSKVYYVDAEGGASVPNIVQDGTGTSTSGGSGYSPGPFSESSQGFVMQFLYTAADILAAGGTAGNITSLAFNCTNAPGLPIPNFKIQVKTVPSTLNTLTWQTGLTDAYTNASLTVSATGWVTFPFATGIQWNGQDNIVVQVCRDLVSGYSYTGDHQYTSTSGRMLYNYNYSGSSCGLSGSYTSTAVPNARFGIRTTCQSPRTAVNANVYPKPAVDLGPDINYCVDQGGAVVLNAGVQPNTPTYLWNNGNNTQVLPVTTTGIYWAQVTNMYTCVGSDTVNVQLRHNPVISLGGDTSVCNGVELVLNPGATGIEYFWSTGQTGQTITVNALGSYNVFVTNTDGCTSMDTIQVNMSGELPTISGVQISNNGQYSFHFTAVNPQNVIGYDWDFGDNSAHSYLANPNHTYANNGNYVVVLRLSSTCGFYSDTTSAHIVGIHQVTVSNDELSVFPNPSRGTATILNKGSLKMERVTVYNVLGQIVYDAKANASDKHSMELTQLASGMYTVEIYTDKGNVARKLEIIR